jgi:hypothetical protein
MIRKRKILGAYLLLDEFFSFRGLSGVRGGMSCWAGLFFFLRRSFWYFVNRSSALPLAFTLFSFSAPFGVYIK